MEKSAQSLYIFLLLVELYACNKDVISGHSCWFGILDMGGLFMIMDLL